MLLEFDNLFHILKIKVKKNQIYIIFLLLLYPLFYTLRVSDVSPVYSSTHFFHDSISCQYFHFVHLSFSSKIFDTLNPPFPLPFAFLLPLLVPNIFYNSVRFSFLTMCPYQLNSFFSIKSEISGLLLLF